MNTEKTHSTGKTAAGVALFYLVALLVNAPALEQNAVNMSYGAARDVCIALARPVATVSRACRLDMPRRAAARFRRRWLDKKTDF